ncbi:MAG: PCRF domain-containing protein, partial [Betaproteobacteria bacterium]|nr:PCRF domain-containing protein [Betaproteobacteria bacterium]
MKPSMRTRLGHMRERMNTINTLLSQPEVISDQQRFRELSKEQAALASPVALLARYEQAERDRSAAEGMLGDADMAAMAAEEIAAADALLPQIEAQLQRALLPRDPDDDKDIFLEIRAGTGGEESALFAADLLRMYTRYAERKRWKTEIVSASQSDLKGYKEVIVRIAGRGDDGAYGALKYESGGHRVQRVPETETQGRVHTSACTVAVMPDAGEAAAVQINP